MKKVDVCILGWHQVYLTANAGGYVRLTEFLKRIPKNLTVILLDNSPTIFSEYISASRLIIYSPWKPIQFLRKKLFLVWLLFETISAGFIIYHTADKFIKKNGCKVIYVPIGEFPQLYLPGIFLKRKYPQIKLVVDILNFELPEKDAIAYFKKLRKSGVGLFRAVVTIVMFYIGYFLTSNTISSADYVFTVSPELVNAIKKVYKKETIDYTPSGVDIKQIKKSSRKKYLGMYIGRVTTQKGIEDLIEAWILVVKKKKDALLGIAGFVDDSLLITLRENLKKKKLTDNVHIIGQVSNDEKYTLLSQSSIFLHLAKYEPLFPVITILEATASGLYTIIYTMPVVQSQQKQLQSEKAFAIIENGNYKKVAKEVIEYLSYSAIKKRTITVSAQSFARKYDWDIIAKKEFIQIQKLVQK